MAGNNELPPLRRIVTGHDGDGKAIVTMDGPPPNPLVRALGNTSSLIWMSDETPAEMWTDEDFGLRENIVQPPTRGSGFRVIDFPEGTPGRMHRTDTVDYALCLAGQCDMELDDGLTVTMKAGDVMVQQGTNHSWINRGPGPCRIAFVLIDGKPIPSGGIRGTGALPLSPLNPLPDGATPVLPPVRRIVTGHDADGKAIILMDGPAPRRELRGRGNVSTLVWGSDETPAEIWTDEDFGLRNNEIEPPPEGSWFRIIDYPAGMAGRMHRTDTVDYVLCLAGEMDMEMDDGLVVPMRKGDVMVQQGTNHSWINNSDKLARIAFALIDAKRKG